MTMASRTNFLLDGALLVRTNGAAAVTTQFDGAAMNLARFASFWHTNELGVANYLQFAVGVEAIALSGAEVYTFYLEIDDNASFTSPSRVAEQVVSAAALGSFSLPLSFDLNLDRADLIKRDSGAAYVRMGVTPAGVAETGAIVVGSTAHDGDTVTIDDGVNTAVVFTFGDGTGGTVDKGLSATASAQNLKAAIEAAVLALTLGVTVSGASTTLSLTNTASNTLGSISTSSGGRITRTNWNGGLNPSISFWASVRGTQGGCY